AAPRCPTGRARSAVPAGRSSSSSGSLATPPSPARSRRREIRSTPPTIWPPPPARSPTPRRAGAWPRTTRRCDGRRLDRGPASVALSPGGEAMLSASDNELLTRTGAGTPMGEFFRRFWVPVLLSQELPAPDGPPVRVTVMGDELVAFRDTDGRVGL